ncbi:MAG TPA: ABC transporter permease [Chitinophaga sp.]|uniref:ABC transporter permease n=1 Tax=Chitinophaga sp. TaxID=1869181 RepID=UPI002DB9A07F|nr:ABC transporter permease [Chitinophaga sp.]HEU4553686.1 ABC transporter permease [Chitinophaga sp.]
MIRNYLKIALRSLARNKTFSIINILGLVVGTICCLYIVMYVTVEYSYDKQHDHVADIYRVNSTFIAQGTRNNNATSSPPIAPAMKRDFPEVQQFTRVVPTGSLGAKQHLLRYNDKSIYETDAVYADSTFFDVFSFHFVYGHPLTSLAAPYCVVLQKSTAEKLFGSINPVGKIIDINNAYGMHSFRVTGVVDESFGKSHIQAHLFMSMNSGGMGSFTRDNQSWAAYNYTASYVKLRPGASATTLERKLPAFLNKYGAQQLKEMGMEKELHLQPVRTIHTTPGYRSELSKTVDGAFLHLLLLVAGLVQLIACINFMNLSTARASRRAKEVGVRKVIGAGVNDLVRQFLGESMLLSLFGVLIALPLLMLALPYLNQVTRADVRLSFLAGYRFWLMVGGIIVLSGLLAGSYPAFYLSAFKPLKVIKGNFGNHLSSAGIRRFLVVFQFTLSIIFISGIIVIYSQLHYIRHRQLGFEQKQQLVLSFYTDDIKSKIPAFAGDLRQLAGIKAVSQADNYPSQGIGHDWPYFLEGSNGAAGKDVSFVFTDEHYVKALGIQLAGGRDFRQGDSGKVLINETFAKELGLNAETAPGKRLYPQQEEGQAASLLEIAGVTKDFNFNSLHSEVKPLMLRYDPGNATSNIIISAGAGDYSGLLEKIHRVWQQHFSTVPFTYAFLDDEVQHQYETEVTLSAIINLFAIVAIFISCLGLFGLSAFSAEQRNKEIGVRKVLGASLANLSFLLSKEFITLTGIAFIIAAPVAWWAMSQWLQGFTYRVSLSWWMFGLAGALAMFITLCTVSVHAISAALVNPVNRLRAE